jgi:hypothetical protein
MLLRRLVILQDLNLAGFVKQSRIANENGMKGDKEAVLRTTPDADVSVLSAASTFSAMSSDAERNSVRHFDWSDLSWCAHAPSSVLRKVINAARSFTDVRSDRLCKVFHNLLVESDIFFLYGNACVCAVFEQLRCAS